MLVFVAALRLAPDFSSFSLPEFHAQICQARLSQLFTNEILSIPPLQILLQFIITLISPTLLSQAYFFDLLYICNRTGIFLQFGLIQSTISFYDLNINIEKMNFLNQQANQSCYFGKSNDSPTLHPDSVVAKISKFLQSRQISIFDFWRSQHNCASATDIVSFCKNSGLELPEYDIINLKSQIFASKEMIYVDKFAQLIPFWEAQGKQTVGQFLKRRSDLLLDKLQAKDKKRPKSGYPFSNKTSSEYSKTLTRQASANRFRKDTQVSSKPMLSKNNSLDYLKKYRDLEVKRQKQLKDNIEKNKIDEEYGMLLKMSELNTLNKERENKITYRAYKSAEGIVRVRVFNLNKFQKEISLNQFDTIYKNFKKTTKENKDWTVAPQTQQKLTDQLQLLKNRNTQKSERQQQLKNLLVNTVNLTNLLKEQIKIFKMKGIYGCENI